MEGGRRNLEAQANEHQREGQVNQHRLLRRQHGRDAIDVGGAGRAKHHRHAIQEECCSERTKQEVLERRFGALRGPPPEAREHIRRYRRNLNRDKDQYQLNGRRHQGHAHGGEQHQSVVFSGLDLLNFEVFERAQDHRERDQDDYVMEEDAERVHPDHIEEGVAVKMSLVKSGGKRRQRPDHGDDAEGLLRVLLWYDRIDQHDEDAEEREHQLWKYPDVVNGRNHRPITCRRA